MKEFLDAIAEIPLSERLCTRHILREWKEYAPLRHQKILINCHLTKATLLLAELFLFSGAEVKITCTHNLVCHESIKLLFIDLGNYLAPEDVLLPQYQHYFDVILDCGAYLANILNPKIAFVELTHVESAQYKNRICPVISVDNSYIKRLETIYGTGDGFVRAIQSIYGDTTNFFTEKRYMIFGYGKVGEGICSGLNREGVPKNNIFVVEVDPKAMALAQSRGYFAYSLDTHLSQVKKLLSDTIDCAVTVTGIQDSITAFFEQSDFSNVEVLANMGTYDEWGPAFSADRVLNNKRPLNFILEYPTKILYLDPIFALYACATLDVLKEKEAETFNIKSPSVKTQRKILDTWLMNESLRDIHKDIEQIWLAAQEGHNLIN